MKITWKALLVLLILPGAGLAESVSFKCRDGVVLPGMLESPVVDAEVRRLIVLLHGSGPQSMDEDLSVATVNRQTNLFFKDLSSSLAAAGFAVLRYDKRSYLAGNRLIQDAKYAESKEFKNYAAHPLKYYVDDAGSALDWARKRFPKAKLYLLGHSEGGQVALWTAAEQNPVSGVAIIGFSTLTLDQDLLEQTVYRQMWVFEGLDKNHDGKLSEKELKGKSDPQKALKAQLQVLDLNADKSIDRSEYMAGNLTNIITDGPSRREYRLDEATLPRLDQVLKDTKLKTIIFQGELDSQTPAYHVKAVELLNNLSWKNGNIALAYFPGLGHALDRRADQHEVLFHKAEPAALKKLAEVLDKEFQ